MKTYPQCGPIAIARKLRWEEINERFVTNAAGKNGDGIDFFSGKEVIPSPSQPEGVAHIWIESI
jgi:hypothetical protein